MVFLGWNIPAFPSAVLCICCMHQQEDGGHPDSEEEDEGMGLSGGMGLGSPGFFWMGTRVVPEEQGEGEHWSPAV